MNASALSLSPSKIRGSVPIACKSAAGGTGTSCCGRIGAGCPPPPPPPPPPLPPPLPPPPPPPPSPVLLKVVAKAVLSQLSTPGGAPPGVGFVEVARAGARGGGALMGAARGPALVVVVVVAAVVDTIVDGCCDRTVAKVLYCPVGVTRGAHSSRSSLCGLPGPSGSITTDVLQRSSCWAGLSSVSVSGSSSLPAFSSIGSTSRSVACTLGRKGPRKGAFMSLVL
jgi:hypothetical protein